MSVTARRVLLLLLAALGAYVGIWAYFLTGSWYRSFPGFGLRWLPVLGPYNEHLSKDVGALYLALAVLSACAAYAARDRRLSAVTGLTWLVFSVPHLIFHVRHLDMYGTRDQILNVVALGLFVVAGAVLTVPVGDRRPAARDRDDARR
ncbi:hypothetical protein [Streptomyces sp. NBC_01497]|uniref:hypothetical protein n=1 Tax=Streptomyces sp. NBC_01497 TaxID=2903885 RepID=UPI002E2F5C53|nr:hypothetical protein [Streptomyces sp. NBC_01497]